MQLTADVTCMTSVCLHADHSTKLPSLHCVQASPAKPPPPVAGSSAPSKAKKKEVAAKVSMRGDGAAAAEQSGSICMSWGTA